MDRLTSNSGSRELSRNLSRTSSANSRDRQPTSPYPKQENSSCNFHLKMALAKCVSEPVAGKKSAGMNR